MRSTPYRPGRLSSVPIIVVMLTGLLSACGGDGGDAVEEGQQAKLNGVEYTVFRTRQLNTHIEPDRSYYQGDSPSAGHQYYAVFIEACNVSSDLRTPTDDFVLLDTQNRSYRPLDQRDNPFAYPARNLEPTDCIPVPDSVAESGPGSALLVFEVDHESRENIPWQLVVDERAGPADVDRHSPRITLEL
jgi:hypothetical protein